ncbi:hypothetical protein [Rubrivivax gelatinosus]|uniref:Uncharacterized protein n=1 Tax=Rubrivivax gelatinosus (strain NBRC 100245 / IL144) TaxID=983917 RepID=I0HP17_RUBGI|nr:hypothetical protein [Rubrivivax gelatinosus]BAL94754.1 hypothetical protein RGE_14130 [Rubrivivax gelatinosus IL144]
MCPAETQAAARHWQRIAMHIRLGLEPDEPRLLCAYHHQGERLIAAYGRPAFATHERMLRLLLDTAEDTLLPVCWRMTCLNAASRPLARLGPLLADDEQADRLHTLSARLAQFTLRPVDRAEP